MLVFFLIGKQTRILLGGEQLPGLTRYRFAISRVENEKKKKKKAVVLTVKFRTQIVSFVNACILVPL